MKKWIQHGYVIIYISGCNSLSSSYEPWTAVNTMESTGSLHHKVNNEVFNNSLNSLVPIQRERKPDSALINITDLNHLISLSLEQAITQFIPAMYRIEIDSDVNTKSLITVDQSKNWLEALGQGMSEANMEFVANWSNNSVAIKRKKITLVSAIETLLPSDYRVFADAEINPQIMIYFDPRQNWVEAFSSGIVDMNIDFTINFSEKIIALKKSALR